MSKLSQEILETEVGYNRFRKACSDEQCEIVMQLALEVESREEIIVALLPAIPKGAVKNNAYVKRALDIVKGRTS